MRALIALLCWLIAAPAFAFSPGQQVVALNPQVLPANANAGLPAVDFNMATGGYPYAGGDCATWGHKVPCYQFQSTSRALAVYCTQIDGTLYLVAADTFRQCNGNGGLVEEARTNSEFQSTWNGAGIGVNPTGWTINGATNNGVTANITGTGTENGLNYIDVSYTGTAVGTANVGSDRSSITETAAVQTQNWTGTVYYRLVSGVWPTSVTNSVVQRGAAGVYINENGVTLAQSSTMLRSSATRNFDNALAAFAWHYWYATYSNGVVANATIRYYAPQLELGAFPTSYIPTTTVAVTRPQDQVTGSAVILNAYSQSGTIYAKYTSSPMAIGGIFSFDDGTSNNRVDTRSNQGNAINSISSVAGVNTQLGTAVTAFNTPAKMAFGWTAGANNNAYNSTLGGGGAPASLPTKGVITSFRFGTLATGSQAFNSYIQRITIWNERLPDATIQAQTQ